MDRERVVKDNAIRGLQSAIEISGALVHLRKEHAKAILALLNEQEEQKRKWLQTIADTQLAISPTGYESEDEMAKRGWEWNGLQMAWEIIAGEERSEHPRLVRCKDCKQGEQSVLPNRHLWCRIHEFYREPEWYCADGERKSD